jgi:hypothetical protein
VWPMLPVLVFLLCLVWPMLPVFVFGLSIPDYPFSFP